MLDIPGQFELHPGELQYSRHSKQSSHVHNTVPKGKHLTSCLLASCIVLFTPTPFKTTVFIFSFEPMMQFINPSRCKMFQKYNCDGEKESTLRILYRIGQFKVKFTWVSEQFSLRWL